MVIILAKKTEGYGNVEISELFVTASVVNVIVALLLNALISRSKVLPVSPTYKMGILGTLTPARVNVIDIVLVLDVFAGVK